MERPFNGWSHASIDFDFKTDAAVTSTTDDKIIATGKGIPEISGCLIATGVI